MQRVQCGDSILEVPQQLFGFLFVTRLVTDDIVQFSSKSIVAVDFGCPAADDVYISTA